MSKASLFELCHGEKKYKEILFPVPDGGSDEGVEMALLIIASSEQLRCRDGLHGDILVNFLLKV